ncbi:MAG: DUF192 domain-containing protein [Deltaproteobacteria bacterium]|nr:DUF192 domain-containing protein [Deltaproteobacteria bacterium]
MPRIFLLSCIILVLILLCTGLMAEERRVVRVYFPDGNHVKAELALSPDERTRGLMFRPEIAPGEGMLFAFEEEAIHPFWMKNMEVPIDILWLDRERRIVHMIKGAEPCRKDPCPSYMPLHPSLFVLELRAGRVEELGLKLRDRLEFAVPLHPGNRRSR